MTYVKQVWTDNVSPVDKAHMDHIEDGLVSMDTGAAAARGAANGYASLDAGVKVPVAQLPTVVQPFSYGTSLPASPVDGQMAILVDSVTNPSYQWVFRYNSGSTSAYKWEFVGGNDLYAEVAGTDTTTSTTSVNLSAGPTLPALPRAGDWFIEIEAVVSSTVADAQTWLGVGDSSVAASQLITQTFGQSPSAGRWSTAHARGRANGLASGIFLSTKAWGSGTSSYQGRRLSARPVRVS